MNRVTLRCLAATTGLAAMLAACGGDEPDAGVASVQTIAGQAQTGPVGVELPATLTARVLNSSGAPIAGQRVDFRVTAGGGRAFAGAVVSDAEGYARERWTLGTTAGPQAMEVRAVDGNGQSVVFARFTASALPGPASTITVVAGDGQSGLQMAAVAGPVELHVADRYGNPTPGTTVLIEVSGGTPSAGSLTTDADGAASVVWTLGMALGPQTLTARLPTGATATAQAVCVPRPPGPPAAIVKLSGDLQTVEQYQALVSPLEVLVTDIYGLGVPDIRVTYDLPASAGRGQATTNAHGRAGWLSSAGRMLASGAQQIPASVAGLPPVVFDVMVTPSIHAYDGAYDCSVSGTQLPTVAINLYLNIFRSVVSGRTHPGGLQITPSPTALNPLTGSLDMPKFKWTNNTSIDMQGTLTIASAGRATGSGSSRRYFDPNPVPVAVTVWSCRRIA
jgi:hypothetical protein